MGILNVSPDSFFDGGRYSSVGKAIDRVAAMISEGAYFIDVGGESTRPGASIVSCDEEASRVVPIIVELIKRFSVYISVNTSQPLIMEESAALGVHLINDIRSLSIDGALEAVVNNSELAVCVMHMQGSPHNMQNNPYYQNILYEIDSYFAKQIIRYEIAGLKKNRLIIDPGFGFGKNLKHNYQLLSNLKYFRHFGIPLLVGISRKFMISDLVKDDSKCRKIGSVAAAVISAMQGAKIIRVHDVQETVEALKVADATLRYGEIF
ncbi:dihydropteroate synthase [Blochmannia endosymbiont of Colobopsis nipponica]|uniref:dihydropteroate synthase n=1 Tax=Blochmannia endosymbiont of Colobopsis nipponica TaxID=2681987 RepID=UPI001780ECCA|nr:dihydropteroate synthase [Blochmannia endosymbiont of Colobopsis nipponica]QOI11325.1 dihydropteroate synthase [Blochmannia endosymbiont of Colobopsis nipponica]